MSSATYIYLEPFCDPWSLEDQLSKIGSFPNKNRGQAFGSRYIILFRSLNGFTGIAPLKNSVTL